MINIMKNATKILLKRKSFLVATFLLPIALIFLFSMLYSSNSCVKIGVINKDNGELGRAINDKLSNLDGIEVIQINENEDSVEKLIFHKYELVVTIDKDFTESLYDGNKSAIKIKSITENDTESVIMGILESETESLATLCNNINVKKEGITKVLETYKASKPEYNIIKNPDKKTNINASVGIIFYLIFISAGLGCGYLLEDERDGTKDRILMGKVNEKDYYGALSFAFFILASVPALEYFIICKVLNYEFGFEKTYLLLVLLLISVLLAVMFNIFLASIIKNKSIFNLVGSSFTIPVFMLSGAFWPYEYMGASLQKIGSALPPRWFFLAIERLQKGEPISNILPLIGGLLLITIFLFLLSLFTTRNRIVLVKENK